MTDQPAAAEPAEAFCDAVRRNVGEVHGPLRPDDAVARLCERVAELAEGRSVAVPAPGSDPLIDGYGVRDALVGLGLDLVAPDHASWRAAIARCAVGVTGSRAAVAETGTVLVACGPGNPRALSLVPDVHVCLVRASTVQPELEGALELALTAGLPANLVWISGPSRSADIEKRITLGVHGPRTFEAVVIDD